RKRRHRRGRQRPALPRPPASRSARRSRPMASGTPPFPTAEAIITEARMYVNDVAPTDAGNLLADGATYTLANFNAAYRFVQHRLANAGVRGLTDYAILQNLLPVATV